MITLQEYFDNLSHCRANIKKKFVGLFINEFIDLKYSTTQLEIILLKNEFLTQFLLIYFNILEQKFNSITKIELLYTTFADKSSSFQILLNQIFNAAFEKLYQSKISWDYELDIEPVERYLRIEDKIHFDFPLDDRFLARDRYKNLSDTAFESLKQEFNSLLREKNNKNLLSFGVCFSYANINLPKTYDIIFDIGDMTRFLEQKTIVRFAFKLLIFIISITT